MRIIKELKYIIILVVVILTLVIVRNYKKNYFASSAKSAYDLSSDSSYMLRVNDLEKISEDFLPVDIREKSQYDDSHLKGAINIPFQDLLNKSSYKIYQHKKVILYSDDISQTVKARLLINQLGFSEIYVLDIAKDVIESGNLQLDSISPANEVLKYKFRPDSTIKPE